MGRAGGHHLHQGAPRDRPKVWCSPRRSFAWALEYYTRAETEYGRGGFALVLLPLFAVFGLSQCLHTPLSLGMGVILCPMFRPHDLGEMLRRYRPEQVCGTTAYWQFLLQDAWAAEADLSFLKVPRCGGDVLPAELERRINAFLAQRGCSSRLIKEYGMSEDGGIMCVSYGSWEDGDVGRPRPAPRGGGGPGDWGPLPPRGAGRTPDPKPGGDEWLLPPARGRPPSAETWSRWHPLGMDQGPGSHHGRRPGGGDRAKEADALPQRL